MRGDARGVLEWAILGALGGVSLLVVIWTQTIGAGPLTRDSVLLWAAGGALGGAIVALLRR